LYPYTRSHLKQTSTWRRPFVSRFETQTTAQARASRSQSSAHSPQAAPILLPPPTPPILPLPWIHPGALFGPSIHAPVSYENTPPRIARAQTAGRAGTQRTCAHKKSCVPHRDVPAALPSVASARRRASEVHSIFPRARTKSSQNNTEVRRRKYKLDSKE
jgi:hypothetical protein